MTPHDRGLLLSAQTLGYFRCPCSGACRNGDFDGVERGTKHRYRWHCSDRDDACLAGRCRHGLLVSSVSDQVLPEIVSCRDLARTLLRCPVVGEGRLIVVPQASDRNERATSQLFVELESSDPVPFLDA